MPQWPAWKKLALVFVVCFWHLVLLAGFSHSFAPGKPAQSTGTKTKKLAITLRPGISKPLADAAAKSQEQTGKLDSKVADAPDPVANQQAASPEAPYWSGLPSRDYFLDTAEVDQPAEPPGDFEALLAKLLPLNIQSVVLEFWISKDGRTVEVRCIEGACSDDVLASLPKLVDLAFAPAVKRAEAVANRKVIQIDVKPDFGL